MARMGRTLEEYAANNGWSSHYFVERAVPLIQQLMSAGVDVKIGRHVIHVKKGDVKFKAYPHYKGRSEEFVTITDWSGNEMLTVHHTEFDKLHGFVMEVLKRWVTQKQ